MADNNKPRSFVAELRRRNVFRVAIAYAGLFWLTLQVADVLFPALSLPDWTIRFVTALLILGLPVALFLAWAYELTPEGLKRDSAVSERESGDAGSGRKLDLVIIGILALALGWFALDKFVWRTAKPAGDTASVTEAAPEQSADAGAGAPVLAQDPTIAVLPFVNMSSDEEQEFFADGLTEELLNRLAKFKALRVIGRTSSFQFKDKNEDLRVIGEKLNAGYILEGSVRKADNTVRVTAQLIAASDGVHLWSETYTRELDNIFAVQDAIAGAVASALEIQIVGQAASAPRQVSGAAYEFYLKALRSARVSSPASTEQLFANIRQAVALAPEFAPAWVLLAKAYSNQVVLGLVPPQEGVKLAHDAVAKALALDPATPGAHSMLGAILTTFDWDWQGAHAAFSRALEIEPNDAAALSRLALLSAVLGDLPEAKRLAQQSKRLDPLNLVSRHNAAFMDYLARDYAQAEQGFREAMAFAGPDYTSGRTLLALSLIGQEKFEEALAESKLESSELFRLSVQSLVYHALGRTAEAEASLQTFIDKYGDRAAVPIAGNYAYRGELDTAMDWQERGYAQRDPQMMWTPVHPLNDNLHGHPRFEALLEKLGLK